MSNAPLYCCYWCPGYKPRHQFNACREYANWVRLSQLTAERKQQLWQSMQVQAPALVELLQDDFVKSLKQTFSAEPLMSKTQFDELTKED